MWRNLDTPAGFGWSWLLSLAMPAALGVEWEIFLLAALFWVAFRPRRGTFALLTFVIVNFLSLTTGHPQLEFRYLINPLLAMALLGESSLSILPHWPGPGAGDDSAPCWWLRLASFSWRRR